MFTLTAKAKEGELIALGHDEAPYDSRIVLELPTPEFGPRVKKRFLEVLEHVPDEGAAMGIDGNKIGLGFGRFLKAVPTEFHPILTPVLVPQSKPKEWERARHHAEKHGKAFVFRVKPDSSPSTAQVIRNSLYTYGITHDMVDVLLDFGDVGAIGDQVLAIRFQSEADSVDALGPFNSITLSATSFPESIAHLPNGWHNLDRKELTAWTAVINGGRRYGFGDYGCKSSSFPPEITGYAPPTLAQLRYSHEGGYAVYRGKLLRANPGQHYSIAEELLNRPEYSGPDYSWGDYEIGLVGARSRGPGNRATIIAIETSHHRLLTAELVSRTLDS